MELAKPLLLNMLSCREITFFIPPFQRNYEWTEDQCEVFLNDILKTCKNNLNGRASEHFFGTITYLLEISLTDDRMSLFRMLCDTFKEQYPETVADYIRINNEFLGDDDPEAETTQRGAI